MFRRPAAVLVLSLALSASAGWSVAVGQARTQATPPQVFEVFERSIPELQQAMADGRITSRGLVDAYFARIAAYDQAGPRLNAVITLNAHAREDADALDRERRSRGPRGPLHGIPVLVKDNYETVDMPTSGGTLALATFRPGDDAFQVKRLREAGAVILGKTAMHELAAGITTISSLSGQTRNPYDLARLPGGSSGGTGAAIAASFAAAGMGSDTCGSIRIPAANQNLVGLRPTRGLSSRSGIIPLSELQDVGGPLARTVTDLAVMLDATVGADPQDPSTNDAAAHVPASFRAGLSRDRLKGARIGVLRPLFGTAPEDDEVGGLVQKALDLMKTYGAELVEVSVPGMDDLLRDSSVIGDEFKFDLAAYLARHPNAPVKSLGEILERGLQHDALEQTFRLRNATEKRESEHYRLALLKRRALAEAVTAVFEAGRLDALAYPTLRRKPALIGEPQVGTTCQLSATTGFPAIAVPAGFTTDGLPVAVELLGPAYSDPTLVSLAYSWEQQASPRKAPFSTPALVNGSAPQPFTGAIAIGGQSGPRAQLRFTYDQTTGALEYDATVTGVQAEQVIALALHDTRGTEPGPVVAHLIARGRTAARDTLMVRGAVREHLVAGQLTVELYTSATPLGVSRTRLALRAVP